MQKALGAVCLATLTVCFVAFPSSAASPILSGKMVQLQYLVGSWSCVNKMSAMDHEPAFTHTSTVTYSILPYNTMFYNFSSPGFFASGFFGYAKDKQLWWNSASDNHAGVFLGTGKGDGSSITFNGKSTSQDESMPYPTRDTYTKLSDSKFEDRAEIKENGAWRTGVVSTCTKR